MASRETIIVSRPKGYFSIFRPIHRPNHMRCTYTKTIDPANRVMASEILFCTLCRRTLLCSMRAGCFGSPITARTLMLLSPFGIPDEGLGDHPAGVRRMKAPHHPGP